MGTIIKILFSKAGGISAIVLLSIFCIFTVFQTGKKEARANGKRELAEYRLKIAENEISQLEKQYKISSDKYADLLKDFNKLNKKQSEIETDLQKAIKEYEFISSLYEKLYRRHNGTDVSVRNAMLKIKKKYNLNKE